MLQKVKDILVSIVEITVFFSLLGALITTIYWVVSGRFPKWLCDWALSTPDAEGWALVVIGAVIDTLLIGSIVVSIVKAVRANREQKTMARHYGMR